MQHLEVGIHLCVATLLPALSERSKDKGDGRAEKHRITSLTRIPQIHGVAPGLRSIPILITTGEEIPLLVPRHHSTMCLMSLPHAVKQMQPPMRTSVPGSGERRTRKDHWQPSITPNLFNTENSPFSHGYVPPSYFGDKILLCNDSDNKWYHFFFFTHPYWTTLNVVNLDQPSHFLFNWSISSKVGNQMTSLNQETENKGIIRIYLPLFQPPTPSPQQSKPIKYCYFTPQFPSAFSAVLFPPILHTHHRNSPQLNSKPQVFKTPLGVWSLTGEEIIPGSYVSQSPSCS